MKKEKANSEEKEVKEAKEVKAQKNAEAVSSKTEEKAPAEKNVTKVGSLLKEMRIQKGLKLPDIAKKLCIRRIYLEAIEESNYAEIPEFPYGIGFIRSYADFLGLNSSNIVELYKEETNIQPEKDIFVLEPQSEATVPGKKYLLVSLAAMIAVYFGWYAYNNRTVEETPAYPETSVSSSGQVEDAVNPLPLVVEDYSSPAEAVDNSVSAEPIAVIDTTAEAEPATPQVVVTNESFPGTIEPKAEPAPAPEAVPETFKPAKSGVVINVKKETWIEVKDDSKLYISKVLQPGDTYTVPQGPGMILSVGKMDGVDIYINGTLTNVFTANRKMNIALDKFISAANH